MQGGGVTSLSLRLSALVTSALLLALSPLGDLSSASAQEKPAAQPAAQPDAPLSYDADKEAIDSFVADKEEALSKNRLKRIDNMRKILIKNPQYRGKADLLFQIAELEWDEAKYHYFLKRKDYDKRYEEYLNGSLSKRPDEPEADYSKALDLYKDLLAQFSNYPKIDQVMFYLGQGLKMAGNTKEMASYMNRLVKEHPQSKYRTRAYLALAEVFFERNSMVAAKDNYLKVVEDTKAPEFPFGLYKLGYTYYNLQEYEDSIKTFQQVIDLGLKGSKIAFQDQAYGALALSFTEVNDGWQRARDYFRGIEKEANKPDLTVEQLERMARIYDKNDKLTEELAIYEYLIKDDETGVKIPEYADYMMGAYKKQEDLNKTEEQINRFFSYFDQKSSWFITNNGSAEEARKSAIKRAEQFRQTELDWMIETFHKKAQEVEKEKGETAAVDFYNRAAKYYDMYLTSFPADPSLYEKEFFLAEILSYQQGKWDDAIRHYQGVVGRDRAGKYSKESAYKVILCAEEKMAVAKLIDAPNHFKEASAKTKAKEADVSYTKAEKDEEFKPLPEKQLDPTESDFLAACKSYTDAYPEDEEVPAISFRAAELFIRAGHYAEGISRLEVIMTYHAKHKFASYAAATLFDANYRLRRWDQMERWGRYMLEKKNFEVLSKKQLEDIIAVSINNYATELSDKGTKLKQEGKTAEGQQLQDQGVDQMLRFIKEFPGHPKASIALFNAAALTERAERTEKAVELYERLIREYKKTSQATEAHFVLGALYESQTKFELAADYFEKMAAFPDLDDKEKMKDSLYNAGAIRMALQQYPKAIKIFETYTKKFSDDKETPTLTLKMAHAYEQMKQWGNARKVYDAYIKRYESSKPTTIVAARLALAESYQKEGGPKARKSASDELALAGRAYAKLSEQDREDKAAKFSAARARFLEGEYVRDDFLAYEIVPFPQARLVKTLQGKAELQQKCEKIYLEVLGMKAYQVSAGAFFRVAEIYNTFAKTLTGLKPPPELEDMPDLLDMYLAFIEEKVLPLEEKAVESARKALDLAHENRIYNEWSEQSAKLLATLSPEMFPVLNDAVVNTDWEVPATFSTTYIADPAGKMDLMIRAAEAQAAEEPKAQPEGATEGAKEESK
jgi:cellulose synthase operon protein C